MNFLLFVVLGLIAGQLYGVSFLAEHKTIEGRNRLLFFVLPAMKYTAISVVTLFLCRYTILLVLAVLGPFLASFWWYIIKNSSDYGN